MSICEAIKERKSIRRYKEEVLAKETLAEIKGLFNAVTPFNEESNTG